MIGGPDVAERWLLPLAVAWDLLLGEPPARAHPVVWMGTAARALERRAPTAGRGAQLAYGALLAVAPPVAYAAAVARGGRWLRSRPPLGLLVGVPLLKSTFAIRELRRAGEGVRAPLAAGLLIAAAAVAGEDAPRALATTRRDAGATASPNAGWPMAAMAGALGVELEKVGHYRLGAGGGAADAATIARADRLVALAAGGAALLATGARLALARRGR